jgi:hypothetical protein
MTSTKPPSRGGGFVEGPTSIADFSGDVLPNSRGACRVDPPSRVVGGRFADLGSDDQDHRLQLWERSLSCFLGSSADQFGLRKLRVGHSDVG